VKVFLGEEDITSQFKAHSRLVMGDGVVGLQPVYYKVELSNDALLVDYSFLEKRLSCQSSLYTRDVPPTMNSSLVHRNADLNITLLCESRTAVLSLSSN